MDHADQILKQAEDVLLNSADHMVELEKMVKIRSGASSSLQLELDYLILFTGR